MAIALIAGSTGLVGKYLLQKIDSGNFYEGAHSISRRKPDFQAQKTQFHTLGFDDLPNYTQIENVADAFCCLGTTMKVAGSKEAFFKVDFEYVKIFAEYARKSNAQRFFLVSALGADKNSAIYYNQVKGQIEEAIQHLGFQSVHIFRPSLLLGDRNEQRMGEAIGQKLATWFDFLIPKKYEAISGEQVAEFMCQTAIKPTEDGIFIYESENMGAQ